MLRRTFIIVLFLSLLAAPLAAASEGQLTWAVHVSLAPAWFDPAETAGIITPFMFLYALHDALVKSMPGQAMAHSLAESWTVSPDNLTYEFVLRRGVKFHNGDKQPWPDFMTFFGTPATGAGWIVPNGTPHRTRT